MPGRSLPKTALFRPSAVRWMARLALFTLVMQLSAVGHWSLGPFHPAPGDLGEHAAHCHGDATACGGQPSFVGTYLERPLLNEAPALATFATAAETAPAFASVAIDVPHEPPRAA